jgi:hypothetical protein
MSTAVDTSNRASAGSPVRAVLRQRLVDRVGRDWAAGSRIPPIRELAQQLGASVGTVRLAVKDLVDQGILESSRRRGTFVNSELDHRQLPSSGNRASATRSTPRRSTEPLFGLAVSVIVPLWEVVDAFTEWAVQAMIDQVERRGGTASMQQIRPHEGLNLGSIESEALVLVNPLSRPPIACQPLKPLVVMNTAMETPMAMGGGYDVVSVDQEQGGYLAGRRLRDAGCRSVAYVGVEPRDAEASCYRMTCSMRLEGFQVGWGEQGPIHRIYQTGYSLSAGGQAVAKFLQIEPRPEAVFAASDELAVGFIVGAMAHGLEAGRDYQIVGFDGQERGKHVAGGPLTTIEVPLTEMAEVSVRLLSQRVAEPDQTPRRVFLGSTLFEGRTVRPAVEAARAL